MLFFAVVMLKIFHSVLLRKINKDSKSKIKAYTIKEIENHLTRLKIEVKESGYLFVPPFESFCYFNSFLQKHKNFPIGILQNVLSTAIFLIGVKH